jgi:hypothetical protein
MYSNDLSINSIAESGKRKTEDGQLQKLFSSIHSLTASTFFKVSTRTKQ